MVGILRRTQRLRVAFFFVDPPLSALFSLLFSLSFLLGLVVLFAPTVVSKVVPGGCYINIA